MLYSSLHAFTTDSLHIFATMTGDKAGDMFGAAKGTGDVNQDGYDDVIIGATGGNYAKLYFGGAIFDIVADLKFTLPDGFNGSRYGAAIASGDFNGDGFIDIAIEAPYYGYVSEGRVYIYYGKSGGIDTAAGKILSCNNWRYKFGSSLAAGDINGDGICDLIVGSPQEDMAWKGRIFIYFGGKNFGDTPGEKIEDFKESSFGFALSIAGDVNKDGCQDLLVGAPLFPDTLNYNNYDGRAYLIYGSVNNKLDSIIELKPDSLMHGEAFGKYLSGLGDMNRDGYDDFAILSSKNIKIYSGKTLELVKTIKVKSEQQYFINISGGYDINNDSFNDLIAGIGNNSLFYNSTLAVYLGGMELDSIPAYINNGIRQFQNFSYYISYAGDVNKDGYKDIIAGDYPSGENIPTNGWAHLLSINNKTDEVEKDPTLVKDYKLFQNYPNPFNPNTIISYQIILNSHVVIKLYDVLGHEIKTLIEKDESQGIHQFNLDATKYQLNSGLYIVRFSAINDKSASTGVIKIMLVK